MASKNTISDSQLPKGGNKTQQQQQKDDDDMPRPESGVFITPQSSHDPDTCVMTIPAAARTQLDSGYRSGLSESSTTASDLSTSTHGVSPRMANFFLATEEENEDEVLEGNVGVLLDSSATLAEDNNDSDDNIEDDDDYCELSGVSVQTLCPSEAVEIPCAATFHNVQGPALSLMQATPPRSYMSHPPPRSDRHGHRYSTGCLTQLSPVIVKILEQKSNTFTGQCLTRGIRVTSGQLHASSSSAELCVRGLSDASVPLPPNFIPSVSCDNAPRPPMRRDRSASAPDIGAIVVQKKCAEELRKISDEFFAEIHKKGRSSFRSRGRRTQAQSHPPLEEDEENLVAEPVPRCNRRRGSEGGGSGSYPGALRRNNNEHSSWWWQAIIQNMAPSAVRGRSDAFQDVMMC